MRLLTAFTVVCLSGCGQSEDTLSPIEAEMFLADYPSLFCEREERCDSTGFETSFGGDMALCVEDMTRIVESRVGASACRFDGLKAAECVSSMDGADCQDWGSADADDEESTGNPCQLSVICGE